MAGKAVAKHSGSEVDPRDEPSAAWGWHGSFPKTTRVIGWIVAILMFAMLIGNHEGDVENVWLIGLGTGLVLVLLYDLRRRRTAWRR